MINQLLQSDLTSRIIIWGELGDSKEYQIQAAAMAAGREVLTISTELLTLDNFYGNTEFRKEGFILGGVCAAPGINTNQVIILRDIEKIESELQDLLFDLIITGEVRSKLSGLRYTVPKGVTFIIVINGDFKDFSPAILNKFIHLRTDELGERNE